VVGSSRHQLLMCGISVTTEWLKWACSVVTLFQTLCPDVKLSTMRSRQKNRVYHTPSRCSTSVCLFLMCTVWRRCIFVMLDMIVHSICCIAILFVTWDYRMVYLNMLTAKVCSKTTRCILNGFSAKFSGENGIHDFVKQCLFKAKFSQVTLHYLCCSFLWLVVATFNRQLGWLCRYVWRSVVYTAVRANDDGSGGCSNWCCPARQSRHASSSLESVHYHRYLLCVEQHIAVAVYVNVCTIKLAIFVNFIVSIWLCVSGFVRDNCKADEILSL